MQIWNVGPEVLMKYFIEHKSIVLQMQYNVE